MEKAITIMADHENAVYLLNRTPFKSLKQKTPCEIFFEEQLNISHLVPFY
jgi:hypothetical protein